MSKPRIVRINGKWEVRRLLDTGCVLKYVRLYEVLGTGATPQEAWLLAFPPTFWQRIRSGFGGFGGLGGPVCMPGASRARTF